MKQRFKDINFRGDSIARIAQCNQIITAYQARNMKLTLRQLYYQLVSRAIIENSEKSYKKLGNLISDARLAGLMDWAAIEDRVRVPKAANEWDSVKDLVEAAVHGYRLPRWEGQDNYVELWVEKDALAGVLWPIAHEFHVTLMVNKGYSSQSAMFESAARFRVRGHRKNKKSVLLYLGDFDPSGEDMVRDIRDRLAMFGQNVDVRKLALTWEQVEQYTPPPNPAKVSDPRAARYIQQHGDESWEVDALPPEVLTQIITDELRTLVDQEMVDEIMEREERDKEQLREAAAEIMEG